MREGCYVRHDDRVGNPTPTGGREEDVGVGGGSPDHEFGLEERLMTVFVLTE